MSAKKITIHEALAEALETRGLELDSNILHKTPQLFRQHVPIVRQNRLRAKHDTRFAAGQLQETKQVVGKSHVSPPANGLVCGLGIDRRNIADAGVMHRHVVARGKLEQG